MWTVTLLHTGPAGELRRAACREGRLPPNAAGRQSLASSPGGRWVRAGSKEVGSAPPSLSLPPAPRVHGPLHPAFPLPPDPLPPEAVPGPHTLPWDASPPPVLEAQHRCPQHSPLPDLSRPARPPSSPPEPPLLGSGPFTRGRAHRVLPTPAAGLPPTIGMAHFTGQCGQAQGPRGLVKHQSRCVCEGIL